MIENVAFNRTSGTSNIDLFTDSNGEELPVETEKLWKIIPGFFTPSDEASTFKLKVEYDVYDKKDAVNPVRKNCKAENSWTLSKPEMGTKYVVKVLVKPTYLYQLSDNDLNNMIIKTAEEKNINLKVGDGLCNEVFDVYLRDEEFDDVGLLAFYINCDPVTASSIKLTFCEDFSKGGNGLSTDVNPACAFFDKITKDHQEVLNLGMYNDLFGNPGNDWHLVVLNSAHTQKVLNFVKENKSFAFSIQANNIIKTGGNVKFTSLFGFKNFKFEENTYVYRHFNNSYSSQLPSWAAGDDINAKNNNDIKCCYTYYLGYDKDNNTSSNKIDPIKLTNFIFNNNFIIWYDS